MGAGHCEIDSGVSIPSFSALPESETRPRVDAALYSRVEYIDGHQCLTSPGTLDRGGSLVDTQML